jgi:hypothetical protein
MTTLSALADRAQNALSDAGASSWSQAVIEEFCVEALREYSRYFPRVMSYSQTITATVQKYTLPDDFIGMVSVEYPADQDPPEYLTKRSYLHPDFWNQDGYYDIVQRRYEGKRAELWISESPASNGTARLEYLAYHDLTLASGDTITVPLEHEDILIQHVIYQAWRELGSAEMQNPTNNSALIMSQVESNASMALHKYRELIRRAQALDAGRSGTVAWVMDSFDRIY